VQRIINGYLLSLSALFAFGGTLADIADHRRMVTIGVIIFATASALCGATGITQTVRNFGSSLSLTVLGTVLIPENKANLESTLGAQGLPKSKTDQIADSVNQAGGGESASQNTPAPRRR
jgi:MFS family permease